MNDESDGGLNEQEMWWGDYLLQISRFMSHGTNERLNLFCTKRLFALVWKNVFTLTSQMDVPFDDLLHKFLCGRAHLEMFRKGRPLPNTKIKTQQPQRSLDEPSVCHNLSTQIRFIHCHLIGNNFPISAMGGGWCASPPCGELPCSAVFN